MRSNPIRTALVVLLVVGCTALFIAIKFKLSLEHDRLIAEAYCVLLVVCGFFIWQHGFRRHREIANVATSKISSASQGYLELYGTAAALPEVRPVFGIGHVPCLWYRYEVAVRQRFESRSISPFNFVYTPIETCVSGTHFAVKDGSGEALIFPHGAEVICAEKHVWYGDNVRYTEERIEVGDPVYALGHFSTSRSTFNFQLALHACLMEWQKNRDEVLRRFDINKNGVIDPEEMDAMKQAAILETESERHCFEDGSEVHLLIAPENGRMFLLSTKPEMNLREHYFFWQAVGLVFFFSGLGGFGLLALKKLLPI